MQFNLQFANQPYPSGVLSPRAFDNSIFCGVAYLAWIMRLQDFIMSIVLITDNGKMASLRPGAKFTLELGDSKIIMPQMEMEAGWYPLVWGQNLKQCRVTHLLCNGVEKFMVPTIKGILKQCGIQLIANVAGNVSDVLWLWRSGRMLIPGTFEEKPGEGGAVRRAG